MNFLDVIEGRDEITLDYEPGTVELVRQHDGSIPEAAQARAGLRPDEQDRGA